MTISDFLKSNTALATGAVILPNLGGWAGAFITKKNIKPWYEGLKSPTCKPPNYVFGPVWTTLYCGIGYASYLVYKQGGGFGGAAKFPLTLYAAQLALNWAWTPIFFHLHELKWVNNWIIEIIDMIYFREVRSCRRLFGCQFNKYFFIFTQIYSFSYLVFTESCWDCWTNSLCSCNRCFLLFHR